MTESTQWPSLSSTSSDETHIGYVGRIQGDKAIKINVAKLHDETMRCRISALHHVHIDDEIEGQSPWLIDSIVTLRSTDLDNLIVFLQKARQLM